jgi:uncharacterized membrane protein
MPTPATTPDATTEEVEPDKKKKWPPRIDPAEVVGGAMAIAVALAWNDVAKVVVKLFSPSPEESLGFVTAYAIVVTIMLIFIIYFINKASTVAGTIKCVVAKHVERKKKAVATKKLSRMYNYASLSNYTSLQA